MRKLVFIIFFQIFFAGFVFAQVPVDTTAKGVKKIIPKTVLIDPSAILLIAESASSPVLSPDQVVIHDPLDTLTGYSTSLGVVGMPYRNYQYGFESAWFPSQSWQDPLSRHDDIYIINPENVGKYYDTRSTWVNMHYFQATRKFNRVFVQASQNLGPLFNITFGIQRWYQPPIYLNHESGTYNIFTTIRFRSPNNRYQGFASGTFNEVQTTLNGGLIFADSIQDLLYPFDPRSALVALNGANLYKKIRGVHTQHIYRFFSDSIPQAHRFLVDVNGFAGDYFKDYLGGYLASIPYSDFDQPVYPTQTIGNIADQMTVVTYKAGMGGTWRYQKNNYSNYIRTAYTQSFENYRKRDSVSLWDIREKINVKGGLEWKNKGAVFRGFSEFLASKGSLLKEDILFRTTFEKETGEKLFDYVVTDSSTIDSVNRRWYKYKTHRPLVLKFSYEYFSRYPSFFMSQNIPELNSTYRADPNLVAPVLNHFRFSVKRTGRALRKAGEILPPNFFEAALFVSNMQRYIYFDTQMQPKQAPLGQLYSWGGVDMNFKVRLLKKIYIENLLTFQSGVVLDSTSELENLFSRMLPGVNGKLSIYYETSDIKIADYLRIGGSMNYTGIYEGLIFDPVSQEFYPSKEPRTGPSYYPYAEAGSIFQWSGYYPRFDVFAVVRIKSATLYAKVLHVNDGWTFVPAYFSTPFYPMIKRSFLFGVNWSFLD